MSNFHGIQAKKDRQRTANAVAGANDAVEGTDPIPPQQPQPQPQQQQLTSTSPSLVNVSVPASSLTTALDAVASAGIPLVGSTIRLQLDGSGFDSAITHLQVDGELLSQLEKGGNINLLIDSTIFTPKSSVAVAGDAGTTTAPVPVNADASAAVPERSMDPTAVAAAAANSSNLPAISPAEIEGLNLNVKKEEHRVRDEGTYRYSCSSLYNVQFWRTHVI